MLNTAFNDEITQKLLAEKTTLKGKVETILGLAVGAGSMCWEDLTQAGVFQSKTASQIVDEASNLVIQEVSEMYGLE